jgi:kynurenine 3-monooxygenase
MADPTHIVGGGLAGSLMALYRARAGDTVHLWERRPDLRRADISAGRSINLALSTRGITALEQVGLADAVLAEAVAMPGRLIHDLEGTTTFQAYGQADQAIQSVSRRRLNERLLEAAEAAGVITHFSSACVDVDLDSGALTVGAEDGVHTTHASALTIGADGIFSAVRRRMQRRARFDFDQQTISHGYTELAIAADSDGGFKMEPHALHIWPRDDFMLIALPNADATFTVTLFLRFDPVAGGRWSYAELSEGAAIRQFFEQEFPDVTPHIDGLEAAFLGSPPSALCTVRCSPFHAGDKVVLVGDAAHGVVPFYGQGMNAAFESARLLDQALLQHADQGAALAAFSSDRIPDTHAIRQLALDHFADMSSATADPVFLQARKLEVHLENVLPGYRSLYGMISFSDIPYAAAVAQAKAQGELLARMGQLVQR